MHLLETPLLTGNVASFPAQINPVSNAYKNFTAGIFTSANKSKEITAQTTTI